MFYFFPKIVFCSGLMSAVLILNSNFVSSNIASQKSESVNFKPKLTNITSLDEIEIFEKENNCYFAFVGSWSSKKVWRIREFLRNDKSKNWDSKVIWGANEFKDTCKTKGSVALFYGGDGPNGNQRFGLSSNAFSK